MIGAYDYLTYNGKDVVSIDSSIKDIKKLVIQKIGDDIRKGAREKCYITVRNRRVSILPFFVNYSGWLTNRNSARDFYKLYASNIDEVWELISKDPKWYVDILGENEMYLLNGMYGFNTGYIDRYVVIGSMRDFNKFYRLMVLSLVSEAIDNRNKDILEKDESKMKYQSTATVTYLICLKWLIDNGYIDPIKSYYEDTDEMLEKVLNIPGPLKEYFDGKIDEKEFRERQYEVDWDDTVPKNLSPIMLEVLDCYDIRPSDEQLEEKIKTYFILATDLMEHNMLNTFKKYRNDALGVIFECGKFKKDEEKIKSLKDKLDEEIKEKEAVMKELKPLKKELKKLKGDYEIMQRLLEEAKKKSVNPDNKSKETIDKLNNIICNKDKEITELKENIKCVQSELENIRRENSDLKKQLKKLSARLEEALDENSTMLAELESLKEEEVIDNEVSIEKIVEDLKGKRIILIGGMDYIGNSLQELGLNVKQYEADVNPGLIDFKNFDCLLFMVSYVPHKSVYAAKSEAKKYDKPIAYYRGTNIEGMCRLVWRTLFKNN